MSRLFGLPPKLNDLIVSDKGTDDNRSPKIAKFKISDTTGTGSVLTSWQNTTGGAIDIRRVTLSITTVPDATGSRLSVGTHADATGAVDNLIDDVNSDTTGTYDNYVNKGSNGKEHQRLASASYLNFKKGSDATGSCTGLVANAYVEFIEL